ncbi:MAG: transcription antitermination factor NusB [Acidobacteriota bacterium]
MSDPGSASPLATESSSRPLGKRRAAREIALRMLYQRDLGRSNLPQIFASFDLGEFVADSGGRRRNPQAALEFAKILVQGTVDHLAEIDGSIEGQAENWRLERMPVVDRNVLRLAVYEMRYQKETPKLVVVDEAIELAKKYGSDQSGRFVNGLLDGLMKGKATDA